MKFLCSLFAASSFFVCTPALCESDSVAFDQKVKIHDDYPEDNRGWVIVARASYWPLCYETLERVEDTRSLIGGSDNETLADSLERCAAWLQLAASAAMVDDEAPIYSISERMEDESEAIRAGKPELSVEQLQLVLSRGELAIAKSHVLRSIKIPRETVEPFGGIKKSSSKLASVVEAERDLRQARIEHALEQLRYDLGQSFKHLQVARVYLKTAGEKSDLDVASLLDLKVVPLKGDEIASQLSSAQLELEEVEGKLLDGINALLKSTNVE